MKKYLCFIMAVIMTVAAIIPTLSVSAAEADRYVYSSAADATLYINTAEDFIKFYADARLKGSDGNPKMYKKSIVLTNDIDLTTLSESKRKIVLTSSERGAVLNNSTFDGGGYEIKGFYLDSTANNFAYNGGALFAAVVGNVTIKNLTLTDFYIKGTSNKDSNGAVKEGSNGNAALVGFVADNNDGTKITVDGCVLDYGTVEVAAPSGKVANLGSVIGSLRMQSTSAATITNTLVNSNVKLVLGEENKGTVNVGSAIGMCTLYNRALSFNIDLSSSAFSPTSAASGIFGGASLSDNGSVSEVTLKNGTVSSYYTTATGSSPLEKLNAAASALELGDYVNEKLLGWQMRTDGRGIRFVGVVRNYRDLEQLGFKMTLSDGVTVVDAPIQKTSITKVYTEISGAGKAPEGCYLFAFAVTGDVKDSMSFTLNSYARDKDGTERLGKEYTYNYGACKNANTFEIYPEFDENVINRDYMYSVSVKQGHKTVSLPVYNHTTDDTMIRNDKDLSANAYRRFSTFAFDEEGEDVWVNIKVNTDFDTYSVLPTAKGFESKYDEATGTISVKLAKPDYFVLRLDGKDSTHLAVFADKPQDYGVDYSDENTTVIRAGEVYTPEGGMLTMDTEGETLYIEAGAVLKSRITVTANNCRIIGRGAILDPASDLYSFGSGAFSRKEFIFVNNADNTVIDGVHLLNSYGFNIFALGAWGVSYAENTAVTNVKILSSQLCTDGISFGYYSKNSLAEHCFVYCGDNALVVEENATYRDIMVGTTCNAIFPQTAVIGSLLEDIYVFRADEGIVNHEYTEHENNPNEASQVSFKIKNLYANDLTLAPYLFKVENIYNGVHYSYEAVTVDGILGACFENVYLPSSLKSGVGMNNIYYNPNTNTTAGAYVFSIKNMYLGDANYTAAVSNLSSVSGAAVTGGVHASGFSYTSDGSAAGFTAKGEIACAYTKPDKVFINKYEVYFKYPVLIDNSVYKLPYEQLARELYYTGEKPATEVIDGIEYVSSDNGFGGMAQAVNTSGGSLIITPKAYGGNLAADNGGLVSNFVELNPGPTNISTTVENGEYVYRITNSNGSTSSGSGMGRMIKDEVLKFGSGSYTLTFYAKAGTAGSGYKVRADYRVSDASIEGGPVNTDKSQYQDFSVSSTAWSECKFSFTVSDADLLCDTILIGMLVDYGFSLTDVQIKDINLVKA